MAEVDTEWVGVSWSTHSQMRHFVVSLRTHTFIKVRF